MQSNQPISASKHSHIKCLQVEVLMLFLVILQLPNQKLIASSVRTSQFHTTNLPQLFKWNLTDF